MKYKRNIVDSKEYKELISGLDEKINEIDKKNIEFEEKKNLLELELKEYRKILDDLDDIIYDLDNRLYNNFRLNQRIDNVLNVLKIGAPLSTFFAFFPFFYHFGSDSAFFASQMYVPFEVANIVWGSAILGGSVVELFNIRKLGISEKTKKQAMKEKKNIELKKEIDKHTEMATEKFNIYSDIREELKSIKNEIAINKKDKENLISRRNKTIELANNYDSINELQRVASTSAYENNQKEKQAVKVLKRTMK